MCLYVQLSPTCGHTTLFSSTNCYLIYDELQRINNPLYHSLPHSNILPFSFPDRCAPRRWNTRLVRTSDGCGSVECANEMLGEEAVATADDDYGDGMIGSGGWRRDSGVAGLGIEGGAGMGRAGVLERRRRIERARVLMRQGRVLGAEGARGGKRLGVGWRD